MICEICDHEVPNEFILLLHVVRPHNETDLVALGDEGAICCEHLDHLGTTSIAVGNLVIRES